MASGCHDAGRPGVGSRRAAPGLPTLKPGTLPHPELPAGTDTLPLIDHIVVLMLENHSYDNFLGTLGRLGADGLTLASDGRPTASNPYADGRSQHAFRMPTTCQLDGEPNQSWVNSHVQYDRGGNDGFVRSGSGPVAMGYWTGDELPFLHGLATTFPVGDRYFSSLLGPPFPNRRYLLAATSFGQVRDDLPGARSHPPNGTILERLTAHGIGWKNYFSDLPTTDLFPLLAAANRDKVVPIADFFSDARAGSLPGFSLVDPHFSGSRGGTGAPGTSQEDPQNIAHGEEFTAQVVNAVMGGPAWPKTMLVYTYDEHGAGTTTFRRRRRWRPTPSVRRSPVTSATTASPAMGSGSPAWWSPPTPAPGTSPMWSMITPPYSSWSRPSGT